MDGLFWVLKWPLSFFDIKLLKDHNLKVNRSTEFNLQLFCGRSVKNLPIMCTDCSQNFSNFNCQDKVRILFQLPNIACYDIPALKSPFAFWDLLHIKYISLVKVEKVTLNKSICYCLFFGDPKRAFFEDILYSTCHAWLYVILLDKQKSVFNNQKLTLLHTHIPPWV